MTNKSSTHSDFHVPQDKQDPTIILTTARTNAALPNHQVTLKMVPNLPLFAGALYALMVRRPRSSPCTSGQDGRGTAWQACAADEGSCCQRQAY